jgi:hypothetical protein
VIADLCRDLGIMPDHPLWPEVQALLLAQGTYVRLVTAIITRVFPVPAAPEAADADGWPAPWLHPPVASCGTGPP